MGFKRDKYGIPATVTTIEYDPNRSARIALLTYEDGEKRYIVAPLGVKVGEILNSGPNVEIRVGNSMPLDRIPPGTDIHNIEMRPGKGGQLVRSAGEAAQLLEREEKYVRLKLPSGEIRLVLSRCYATIGQVGNSKIKKKKKQKKKKKKKKKKGKKKKKKKKKKS